METFSEADDTELTPPEPRPRNRRRRRSRNDEHRHNIAKYTSVCIQHLIQELTGGSVVWRGGRWVVGVVTLRRGLVRRVQGGGFWLGLGLGGFGGCRCWGSRRCGLGRGRRRQLRLGLHLLGGVVGVRLARLARRDLVQLVADGQLRQSPNAGEFGRELRHEGASVGGLLRAPLYLATEQLYLALEQLGGLSIPRVDLFDEGDNGLTVGPGC